ncbi:serine/threonine-protein kinase [Haloferula sp. BvORR071]|uniref:serine/threonine-protein kinase n=1 Tax=Haloferula sp. BvORR071 TaxID=1396141 RepID=UPI00069651F0|nr:serine/threonine-protein kinase [Haloferula sp. BvORR071]
MSSQSFEAPTLEALSELLPAYEFTAFIAQGGMGAVYKAKQRALDRDVAVKVLPRELGDDPDFRQSFETEAKAMGRLNHPNLIGVYDFGAIDGMLYIVMEYVNGKSLYHSAYNMAVDPEQAAAIVKGICDGLAHAHENGVIHRDIKPANILLNEKIIPKIGDFGLARPHWAEGPGLIMGTPGYTAPEIYDNPEHSDRRTDIFAVGVILYELMTGQRPEETSDLPSAIVNCDKRLDAIFQKATDINPDRRYATAEEMSLDLATWANKEPEGTPLRTMQKPPVRRQQVGAAPIAHTAPRRRPGPAPVVVQQRRKKNETDWGMLQHILIVIVVLIAVYFLWKKFDEVKKEKNAPPPAKEEQVDPAPGGKTPPAPAPAAGTPPTPAPKPGESPAPATPPKE